MRRVPKAVEAICHVGLRPVIRLCKSGDVIVEGLPLDTAAFPAINTAAENIGSIIDGAFGHGEV